MVCCFCRDFLTHIRIEEKKWSSGKQSEQFALSEYIYYIRWLSNKIYLAARKNKNNGQRQSAKLHHERKSPVKFGICTLKHIVHSLAKKAKYEDDGNCHAANIHKIRLITIQTNDQRLARRREKKNQQQCNKKMYYFNGRLWFHWFSYESNVIQIKIYIYIKKASYEFVSDKIVHLFCQLYFLHFPSLSLYRSMFGLVLRFGLRCVRKTVNYGRNTNSMGIWNIKFYYGCWKLCANFMWFVKGKYCMKWKSKGSITTATATATTSTIAIANAKNNKGITRQRIHE